MKITTKNIVNKEELDDYMRRFVEKYYSFANDKAAFKEVVIKMKKYLKESYHTVRVNKGRGKGIFKVNLPPLDEYGYVVDGINLDSSISGLSFQEILYELKKKGCFYEDRRKFLKNWEKVLDCGEYVWYRALNEDALFMEGYDMNNCLKQDIFRVEYEPKETYSLRSKSTNQSFVLVSITEEGVVEQMYGYANSKVKEEDKGFVCKLLDYFGVGEDDYVCKVNGLKKIEGLWTT